MQSSTNPTDSPSASDEPEAKPEPRRKTTALFNFWVDVALGLAVTFLVWVSVMMQVVFPAPTTADGWRLWGLTFDQWRDLQFFALCVCALIAVEHVVLHWNWICSIIATKVLRVKSRPDEGTQAVYGVATFIAIAVVLKIGVIVALLTVQRPQW